MLNVFRVNEYDCVVAEYAEDAREWYLEEYGVEDEDIYSLEETELVDPNDTMWVNKDELSDMELREAMNMKNGDVEVTYQWAIVNIHQYKETPYHISSTEW